MKQKKKNQLDFFLYFKTIININRTTFFVFVSNTSPCCCIICHHHHHHHVSKFSSFEFITCISLIDNIVWDYHSFTIYLQVIIMITATWNNNHFIALKRMNFSFIRFLFSQCVFNILTVKFQFFYVMRRQCFQFHMCVCVWL